MKKRNPIGVFFLGIVTIGIYSWYWAVKTKGEMNRLGEKIPTAWLWLIPLVGSIWWYWKYSEAVEHVTHEKLNGVLAFILLMLLGNIGQAIIQNYFNESMAVPLQPLAAQPVNVAASPQPITGVENDQQPPSPQPVAGVENDQQQPPTPPISNTPVIG